MISASDVTGLNKSTKSLFIATAIRKQDIKFLEYHKAHATNFKLVSKSFFKFYNIAAKTQRKLSKVNIYEKNAMKTFESKHI